jgi:methionyl-tRNA synthetase
MLRAARCLAPTARHLARGVATRGVEVTTPIFYVNGAPHIGHLYSALLADACARSHRVADEPVLFSTGTDEHGLKVHAAAAKGGVEPGELCDRLSSVFRSSFDKIGISYDVFVRTTSDPHKQTALWVWNRLWKRGYIYPGTYEAWYCTSDEAFLTEQQVQVLPDGSRRSKESGHPVELVSEPNWIFRLSALRKPLIAWLESHPHAISPLVRRNEVMAWLRDEAAESFRDLSVSRPASRVPWGIPIPEHDSTTPPSHSNQVMYVWLDALTNYLSTVGGSTALDAATDALGRSADDNDEAFRFAEGAPPAVCELARGERGGLSWDDCEAAPATRDLSCPPPRFSWPCRTHVIGKDILRFHAVYWPAFLLAAGIALPEHIVAHGHFTVGKVKMSKSLGNVVTPEQLHAPTAKGWAPPTDAIRWALLKCGSLASDGDFELESVQKLWKTDLADTVGNLLSRATGSALLPEPVLPSPGSLEEQEKVMLSGLEQRCQAVRESLEDCRASAAIDEVLAGAAELNAYFASQEPWKLAPGKATADSERMATVLWSTLEGLRLLGCALQPLVPQSADALLSILNVPQEHRTWDSARLSPDTCWRLPGTRLNLPGGEAGKRPSVVLFHC